MRDALTGIPFPIVVKPSTSGGSDMCAICDDLDSAVAQVNRIIGATSLLGHINIGATAQEYLRGPQLFVNTVSAEGRHLVTEVFEYTLDESTTTPTIRAAHTIDPRCDDAERAVEYVLSCLDALGVRFGAGHTEVRMTTAGPRLVEFNGRMMGPSIPADIYGEIRGYSQADVFAEVIRCGSVEEVTIPAGRHDELGWYMLSADVSGTIRSVDATPIRAVPGVVAVGGLPPAGATVSVDNRVTTGSLGMVWFRAADARAARGIVEEIATLEAAGTVFDIEAAA
ncbi:hypothetical protein ACQ7HM_14655 [Williamsia sp. MIQD14]|uniref:hypothetical protein n=1 Tax=Williamsia sp. MIQD14 TaxID=3425703 RepID=UPI003DA07633